MYIHSQKCGGFKRCQVGEIYFTVIYFMSVLGLGVGMGADAHMCRSEENLELSSLLPCEVFYQAWEVASAFTC